MEVSQYLKLHYRAIVTKTGAGVETRQTDKAENLEITGKALPLKLKTKEQKHTLGKKAYSTKGAGKTRYPPKKNKVRAILFILHKNQFPSDQRP